MDNLILPCLGSFSCTSCGHSILDLLGKKEGLFMVQQYKAKMDAGLSKTAAVLWPNFMSKKGQVKQIITCFLGNSNQHACVNTEDIWPQYCSSFSVMFVSHPSVKIKTVYIFISPPCFVITAPR